LARYLNEQGSYEGIDIVRTGVEWCQQNYRRFPNFRFHVADIYNDMYNKGGRVRDVDYTLPFPDNEFDLVYLCSVFTHMMNDGINRYLIEISRVLKVGGRCFASFFLLNPDTLHWMANAKPVLTFPHVLRTCRLSSLETKSGAVAVDELWLRGRYLKSQLRITDVTYGYWCGGRDLTGSLQDTVVAIKM
jgi:SAM-dependent methyltransferase